MRLSCMRLETIVRSAHKLLIFIFAAASTPLCIADGLEDLGKALFDDVNLSQNRTLACATCHAPDFAYTDTRPGTLRQGVSTGDDGLSLARRHTPTLTYIDHTPPFAATIDGSYEGGFFYDGRAASLAEQAQGPLLSPLEMGMPDTTAIAARITENVGYVQALKSLFGPDVMDSPATIFKAVTSALSAFQMSGTTSSFDSKYDRYLAGEEALNPLEEQGRLLFFSTLVNCNTCHLIDRLERETFTNYSYHNIGIPANASLARIYATDLGLAEHPEVEDPKTRGQFKVPTLRNIAVTAPYMHNGVFKELRTVLAFYNQFILQTPINPERGEIWRPPEVDENLSHDLLRRGQPLNPERMEAIMAFLMALTDKRYEPLLDQLYIQP